MAKYTEGQFPVWLLQHSKFDGQNPRSADKNRRQAAWHAGNLDPGQPAQQFLEKDLHFQPSQMLAEADVRTIAEGKMAAPVPVDAKTVRCVEDQLIPVSRQIAQHQPVASGE